MNLISKLYRAYKREKKEELRISDREEPLIISRTRMPLLELEIKTLAYYLSREIKTNFRISDLPEIKWAEITLDDLDKLESILLQNIYEIEMNPTIKSLVSILRGLLDTHKKFFNGKVMPFYVKLNIENLNFKNNLEENVNFPFINDEGIIRQPEKINSNARTSQTYISHYTPRNLSNFNKKVELPIKSRISNLNLESTPRNNSCRTPRTKSHLRFTNLDQFTPKSDINKKSFAMPSGSNTPRKNSNGIAGNIKVACNQPGSVMAAKALLGLSTNLPATEQEIRKAYLKAAMKWHPDKISSNTSEKSHICFTAIQNAMEILLQSTSKNKEV